MQRTPDFGDRFNRAAAAVTPAQRTEKSGGPPASHQLCFASLLDSGRVLFFPCDRCGEVELDALSDRARNDYYFARTVVGRDYGMPTVRTPGSHSMH